MNTRITLILAVLFCCFDAGAQPFWKTYPVPNRPQQVVDLIAVENSGYAFLRDHSFVLTNKNGQIQREWTSGTFADLPAAKLIRTNTGKFVIAANSIGLPGFWLYILSADATEEKTYQYQFTDKVRSVKMLPGENGNFFLTYVKEQEDKPERLHIHYLNETGAQIWKTEIAEGVFFNYALQSAGNGGLHIAYTTPDEVKLKVFTLTANGDRSEQEFTTLYQTSELYMPEFFCKTPDGGWLFAATELSSGLFENSDLLLLKANAAGQTEWEKLIDISMNDEVAGLQYDANGFYILSNSGYRVNWYDLAGGTDLVVSKYNWNAEPQWKRAFGTAGDNERANVFLLSGNELLLGGWARIAGQDGAAPLVIKTTLDADLQDAPFVHPLQPVSALKQVTIPATVKTTEIVHSITLPGGGYLATAKLIGVTEDEYVACLIKIKADGEQDWIKFLSEFPATAGKICTASDGNYFVLLSEFDTGIKVDNIVKLNAQGQTIWKQQVWARYIDDIAASNDGGCYVSGGELENTVEFHAMVLKLNANGTETWRKQHVFFNYNTRGNQIKVTADNKLVIAGISEKPNGADPGIFLMHANVDGDALWSRVYVKPDTLQVMQQLMITPDQHFVVSGFAQSDLTGNRDVVMLKVNKSGNMIWSKVFDLNLQDNSSCLVPKGDTAYCLAGSTGEPLFGTRKQYGFLANIKLDGVLNGVKYYGSGGPEFTIRNVFEAAGGRLHFLGNRQEQYGNTNIFFGTLDPVILSGEEVNNTNGIKIFPNPCKGNAWLLIDNGYAGDVRLSVTGINGVNIKSRTIQKISTQLQIPLLSGTMPAGVYQVEIVMGKERVVKQWVLLP